MFRTSAIRGICSLWAACLLLLGSGAGWTRTVLELEVARQPVPLLDWGDYWIDPRGNATVNEVLQLPPHTLRPTIPGQVYALAPHEVLWIRFAVPAAPDHERWYLKLADPSLDRVTLYTRTEYGEWEAQSAGDSIPVAQWPLPHLYPVLPLAVSAADPGFYLLRIKASGSFSAALQFVSESHLSREQQRVSLLHGMYFGLLGLVTVFALTSALIMRDAAYLWYAGYAAVINFTVASGVGIAGLHLWPAMPAWNDAAPVVLPLLSFAPLLVFIALTASFRARSVAVFWSFCALAVLALGGAVALGFVPASQRLVWLAPLVVCLSLAGVAGLAWAWYHGDRFARWLLAAFVPMLLALPFPVLRWLGHTPVSFLSQHAVQLALAVTLPTVFLLLILRSQERRDYRRRITQLDQVDPLTGLVNDEVFQHRLRGMIERSRRFNCQSAVVLVDFTNLHQLRQEFGRKAVLEVLLRLAGRLTSLVREVDTVARVGEARYGILMEGPVPPERGASLGSKLLARIIMPFPRMPAGLTVRPKIAVAMVPMQGDSVEGVLQQLDAMLKEAPPDNRKTIFVADSQPFTGPASLPPSQPASQPPSQPASLPGGRSSGNRPGM